MAAASFAAVLATLTANSRPIINTLTLIATDARAVPADAHAIVDALSNYGIRHFNMPATPLRVWEAIQQASASR